MLETQVHAPVGQEFGTVHGLLERAARLWPDKDAARCPVHSRWFTYADLAELSGLVAAQLRRRMPAGADTLAVLLENRVEYMLIWLAAAACGYRIVPVNTRLGAEEIEFLVSHSNSALVVTSESTTNLLPEGLRDTPRIRVESILDRDSDARAEDLIAAFPVTSDTPINIQYTSGSTGLPKGCVLSHGYWTRVAQEMCAPSKDGSTVATVLHDDRLVTVQPMYYMDPFWQFLSCVKSGASLVVLDAFHPTTLWGDLRAHKATMFYCLGAMPALMLRVNEAKDRDHHVRAVLCSAIPRELHAALEDRWGAPWFELYGMTESGVDIRSHTRAEQGLPGEGLLGLPTVGRHIAVLDEAGAVARTGRGELLLRGPHLMQGYFRDPVATDDTFHLDWLRTGDQVEIDGDGRVKFMSRIKDVFKRSGENISASQVEAAIVRANDVPAVACLGISDDIRGQEILAVIEGPTPDPAKVKDLVRATSGVLAQFKVPRYWSGIDAIPRTPSERIAKGTLRAEMTRIDKVVDATRGEWVDNPLNREGEH